MTFSADCQGEGIGKGVKRPWTVVRGFSVIDAFDLRIELFLVFPDQQLQVALSGFYGLGGCGRLLPVFSVVALSLSQVAAAYGIDINGIQMPIRVVANLDFIAAELGINLVKTIVQSDIREFGVNPSLYFFYKRCQHIMEIDRAV